MATTSSTTTTPATQTNLLTTLGAATLDTKKLVSDLVAATRDPQQAQLDKKRTRVQASISSLAQFKSVLGELRARATDIGTLGGLNRLQISNSAPAAVTVTSGGQGVASAGNHSIQVTTVATAGRRASTTGYALSTTQVAAAASTFTVSMADGTTQSVALAAGTTLTGVATAINAANLSVTARVVNTGSASNPYQLVLEGSTGAANGFTAAITDDATQAVTESFATSLQTAKDASLTVDGLSITRTGNVLTDVLPGLTLKLSAATQTAATVGVSFDASAVAASVQSFVDTYNVASQFITKALGPPVSGDPVAGSLAGNSVVRTLRDNLRGLLTQASSAPAATVKSWMDFGVSLDKTGVLQFDTTRFNTRFDASPEQVIQALSANLPAPAEYSGAASGLAGDIAVKIFGLTRATGALTDLGASYQADASRLDQSQSRLDKSIAALQARYDAQFNALNAVLSNFKSTQDSLKGLLNQNQNNNGG